MSNSRPAVLFGQHFRKNSLQYIKQETAAYLYVGVGRRNRTTQST